MCRYRSHLSCLHFIVGVPGNQTLNDREITIFMGNATKVAAVTVGDVSLSFGRNKTLVLRNCLYVPSFRKNLILVSKLFKDEYSILFDNKVVIKKYKHFICSGILVDNLYTINPIPPMMQLMERNNTSSNSNKRKEPSQMNQTYLWHLRLGHINLGRIQRLVTDEPLGLLEVE